MLGLFIACGPTTTPEAKIQLPKPDADNGRIQLPPDFGAVVVADSLGRGRHIAVRDNGDIYVKLRRLEDGKGIVALRDTNMDGRADIQASFGDYTGTGVAIHKGHLYASSDTSVYRYAFEGDGLLPNTQGELIVGGFINQGQHASKPFTFDQTGNIYVNVGAPSNACQQEMRQAGSPGIDPCPQLERQAGIWQFKDDLPGQTQEENGHRYATGIRNAMALEWNNVSNSLYALQHGRDDLHRLFDKIFAVEDNTEKPAEEFLQVSDGDDFGWPYCYYDPTASKKFVGPEYGGNGRTQGRCEGIKEPIMAFPAHLAPNDLLFYTGDLFPERYQNGAFIAFHGSWNRIPNVQQGFFVVFVPMKDGKPSGNWEVFADGFVGPTPVKNPGKAVTRPCGLAQGPDGSLYVVDSQVGKVWRIMYYEEGLEQQPIQHIVEQVDTTQTEEVPAELAEGKKVYDFYCMACHQTNGMGVPGMNPPLGGTDWVTGDKNRLIGVVLNGLSDPIEINGETYQNAMASHRHLTDRQISDVLTYIRKSFGNDADAVTPDEVASVRAEVGL